MSGKKSNLDLILIICFIIACFSPTIAYVFTIHSDNFEDNVFIMTKVGGTILGILQALLFVLMILFIGTYIKSSDFQKDITKYFNTIIKRGG